MMVLSSAVIYNITWHLGQQILSFCVVTPKEALVQAIAPRKERSPLVSAFFLQMQFVLPDDGASSAQSFAHGISFIMSLSRRFLFSGAEHLHNYSCFVSIKLSTCLSPYFFCRTVHFISIQLHWSSQVMVRIKQIYLFVCLFMSKYNMKRPSPSTIQNFWFFIVLFFCFVQFCLRQCFPV